MSYASGFTRVIAAAGLLEKTALWPFGPDLDKATDDAAAMRSRGFFAGIPLDIAHSMTGYKISPFNVGARLAPGMGSMYGTRDLDLKYQLGAAIGGEASAEIADQAVTAVARAALRGNLPDSLRVGKAKIPISSNWIASLIGSIAGEGAAHGGIWTGLHAADAI